MDLVSLSLHLATTGANTVEKDFKKITDAAKKAESQVEKLKGTFSRIGRLLELSGVGSGVKELLEVTDKMQSMANQVRFTTQTVNEFNLVQKELFAIAQNTGASLEGTTQLYVRASNALRDYGFAQKDILKFTENINKTMAVGGATAQEQAGAMLQLSQALGAGKLQGNDYKSISAAAPILLDTLAQSMGKTRAELDELASKGQITADAVFKAFSGNLEGIEQKFSEMPLSFGSAMQMLQNSAMKFIDDVNSSFGGLSNLLANGIAWIAENVAVLAKAIIYATGAYAAFIATAFAQDFKKATGGVGLLRAAFGALAAQIRTTYAALMANPWGLLIAGITAAAYAFDVFLSDSIIGANEYEATWGDALSGVWNDFTDLLGNAADYFKSAWTELTETGTAQWDSFGGAVVNVGVFFYETWKTLINGFIGYFDFAYHSVMTIWGNFPAALESLGISAFNGLLSVAEKAINLLIELIKAPLKMIDYVSEAVGVGALFGTDDWKVDFSGFKKEASQEAQEVAQAIKTAFDKANTTDYVGNAASATMQYLTDTAVRYKQTRQTENAVAETHNARTALPSSADKGKSGKSSKARSGQDHLAQWQSYLSELERANADSFAKIALEQDRALREMSEKARQAGAAQAEIEQAKTQIFARYAKERQAIAERYAPELQAARELQEKLAEIEAARRQGLLTDQQAYQAAERTKWDQGSTIAQTAAENAVSPYEKWKAEFDPMQAIANEQNSRLAQLQSFYDQGLIQYQDFVSAKAQIDQQAVQSTQDLFLSSISGFGSAWETMTDVMRNAKGEQSSIYQTMFAMSKAFAIADSMMKIQQAIANAAAAPYPANIAAMATVASQTASIISNIQGITMAGQAHSGIDYIPREGTWLLDKGERVVDSRTNADLKTFLANANHGNTSGGKSSVNVKIINNGQPVDAKVSSEETADGLQLTVELLAQMDKIADHRYRKNQMNDLRNGGVKMR